MESSVVINDELYIIEESFTDIDAKNKKAYEVYYNEIKYYPVLTREEEQALFIKWKKHKDITAKERLIKCNLRYVVKVAFSFFKRNEFTRLNLEDLIQEGNIGLIMAIDKFDYTKGYRFLTYADQYITNYMWKALYNKERLIRIPENIESDYRKIKSAYSFIAKNSKDKITLERISKVTGIELKKIKRTLEYIKTEVYMETPIKNHSSKQEGSEKTLGDTLIDNTTANLMELVIEENMQSERYKFLDKLSYQEKNIILQKYNPHGKIVTDEELALINNTTVKDIQNKLKTATRKLRQNQKRPLY